MQRDASFQRTQWQLERTEYPSAREPFAQRSRTGKAKSNRHRTPFYLLFCSVSNSELLHLRNGFRRELGHRKQLRDADESRPSPKLALQPGCDGGRCFCMTVSELAQCRGDA